MNNIKLVITQRENEGQLVRFCCNNCNALLFKAIKKSKNEKRTVEIKCRHCGEINTY